MAITTGDVQSVQNYFAMNELNTNLNALTTQLKKMPGQYAKIGDELETYTKALSGIKPGTGYGGLSKLQKDTFEQINATLRDVNLAVKKSKADEEKQAVQENRAPNPQLIQSLDQMKRAVINSSASIKAYYKASPVKGVVTTGLGEKDANIQSSVVSIEMYRNQKNAAKATSDAINNLADSFKLSPSSNPQIVPSLPQVSSSTAGTRSRKGTKEAMDAFIPPSFSYLAQGLSALNKGLSSMVSGVAQFGGALGTAYSAIMSGIGDMLDDPFSGTISIIKGLSSLVSSAMSLISSMMDSIFNFITSLMGSGGDDEKGSSSVLANLLSAVFGLISSLFTMAIQAIQSGFQMFASTLETTLKLIKKIALSSPIIKAILELLNLAFTLFFMPFMNSFALVLLPYVLSLLEWATTMGNSISEMGLSLGETLLGVFNEDEEIKNTFTELVDTFVEDLLPELIELIPALTKFSLDFVKDILSNSEDIISFLKKGFEAFSALMDANILGVFLNIGKKTMEWLKDNAPALVTFIAVVMTGLLKIASFFTKIAGSQTDIPVANSRFIDSVSDLGGALSESLSNGTTDVDVSTLSNSAITAGTGGIFRPMNGGIPVLTAEAGEGEFQLTDAELREIGKDTTVSIQYNGMVLSRNDFKNTVRQTMTDISTKSYYR